MVYTKRARVFIGTACNIRCRFCYYYYTDLKQRRPPEDIKKQLELCKKNNMDSIDFSGGEPTVIPELPELIKKARKEGFKGVGIVTNGQRLSDPKYAEKIITAGLTDVLFSVHGCSPEEHDYITQIPGSFKRLMTGIQNVKKLGVPFRINCTVTRINYKNLEQHARLYLNLQPLQVNFILFNDWETADKLADNLSVRYSKAAPYLKKAIRLLEGKVDYVNVRYIPFCFMRGFEKHVCDYPQKIHDPFEWSQKMLLRLTANETMPGWKYHLHLIYGLLHYGRTPRNGVENYAEDAFVSLRRNTYIKTEKCRNCRYYRLCDGLERTYVDIWGDSELKPRKGEEIKDPLYFRKSFYPKKSGKN